MMQRLSRVQLHLQRTRASASPTRTSAPSRPLAAAAAVTAAGTSTRVGGTSYTSLPPAAPHTLFGRPGALSTDATGRTNISLDQKFGGEGGGDGFARSSLPPGSSDPTTTTIFHSKVLAHEGRERKGPAAHTTMDQLQHLHQRITSVLDSGDGGGDGSRISRFGRYDRCVMCLCMYMCICECVCFLSWAPACCAQITWHSNVHTFISLMARIHSTCSEACHSRCGGVRLPVCISLCSHTWSGNMARFGTTLLHEVPKVLHDDHV
jgi:hypothetical protein